MPSIRNILDTWSDALTSFNAFKMNVTDTASASDSKLIDLQVGGVSKLSVDKNGDVANASAKVLQYIIYDDVAALLASTESLRGTGEIWEAGGFRYIEVASGGDVTNSAGTPVQLDVLPNDGRVFVPHQWGAVEGGATDATTALQAFFDHTGTIDNSISDWSGVWGISSTITIPAGQDAQKGRTFISGTLQCLNSITTALIINSRAADHLGKIAVYGTGGADYTTRTVENLVVVEDSIRAKFDGFVLQYCQGWGLSTGSGNNIDVDYGRIRGRYTGSNAENGVEGNDLTFTGRADSGSADNANQRTTLTFASTGNAAVGDIWIYAGNPYLIKAKTSTTIDVFPWITPLADTTGTGSVIHGGCVLIDGNDTATTNIGAINCQHGGVALSLDGLFGAIVENLQAQNTGIALMQNGLNNGTTITGFHCEAQPNGFDFLQLDTPGTNNSTLIASISQTQGILDATGRYSKFLHLNKVNALGERDTGSFSSLNFVSVLNKGKLYTPIGDGQGAIGSGANNSGTNTPNIAPKIVRRNPAVDIALTFDFDADRLFGINTMSFLRSGSNGEGGHTGDTTMSLSTEDTTAGHTVMGGATYVIPAHDKAVLILAFFDYLTSDWIITYSAPSAQQTAIPDLTDNSGGSADSTIAAVSGSGDDSTINNNFADLAADTSR